MFTYLCVYKYICTHIYIPLDGVIHLSALATVGLLRTTFCQAAIVLVGFIPAEIQIHQRIEEFHLRQLAYRQNLISEEPLCVSRTHEVSRSEILDAEVMRLDRYGVLPQQLLQRVESHHF